MILLTDCSNNLVLDEAISGSSGSGKYELEDCYKDFILMIFFSSSLAN